MGRINGIMLRCHARRRNIVWPILRWGAVGTQWRGLLDYMRSLFASPAVSDMNLDGTWGMQYIMQYYVVGWDAAGRPGIFINWIPDSVLIFINGIPDSEVFDKFRRIMDIASIASAAFWDRDGTNQRSLHWGSIYVQLGTNGTVGPVLTTRTHREALALGMYMCMSWKPALRRVGIWLGQGEWHVL
jgi:hypothetical protein